MNQNVNGTLKKLKLTTALIAVVFLASCKGNLKVQSSNTGPNIVTPIISVPASSPFYSQSGNLTIQGVCKTGTTILLTGSDTLSTDCLNSQFSFNVTKVDDGVYNYLISQNENGVLSTPASFVWYKKTSVSQPSLTNPVVNPYSSSEAVLNITGGCETGSTISLRIDGAGSAVCVNSQFSISLPKFADGNYTVQVVQTDLANNEAHVEFVWQKQSLNVIPSAPQVIVGSNEPFTITGGTPPYSVTILQNNSVGASYNSMTNIYTAGTVAGVSDVLQITDAQGFSRTVSIQILSDVPDHFEFPAMSGNSQSAYVGKSFSDPLTVKVVDRFGNGVSNYPVLFQRTAGDVFLIGDLLRRTNAQGLVSLSAIQGYTAARSYVTAIPLSGTLPDVNATGLTKLRFTLFSQSRNSSAFDLNFSVGNNPENSIVVDLNNDGHQDMLILNKGAPSISRFLGRGNGLFTSLSPLTGLCSGPSGMTSEDYNNDSFKDLIIICNGIGQYSFISGRGDGTFNSPITYLIDPQENLPVDVASGDFDANGAKDIVVASAAANNISVRLGNNNGTFSPVTIYNTGNLPSKIAVGDLNNDNREDIAVINASDETISVFINNGNGTFQNQVVYPTGVGPSNLIIADLNSDNFNEIIVANNSEDSISVYLNLLDGTFDSPSTISVGIGPISLVAKDFNADTFVDLAVANISDSTISILYGQNNTSFDVQPSINSLTNPININSGDFNGDSYNDILVVSNAEAKIQIIPTQASGRIGFTTSVLSTPVKTISADIDGDGFLDKAVVSRSANSLSLFKGIGNGTFSSIVSINVGNGPSDATFVDLNDDGILDIVVVLNSANSIRVYLGQGGGVYTTGSNFPVQSQPTSIVSGDFNKDGLQDVAVTCSGANRVNFLPGNGDGTFGTRVSLTTGSQPSHLTTADFNDDYLLDIAVVNQSEDSVTVFLSNGNGTFNTSGPFDVQSGPNGIVAGFLDSDGFIDIAVSNNLASSISVLKGLGDGTFNNAVNYFAGVEPIGLTKGDLNGNGREDLVVGNGVNQTVTILFASAGGTYTSYVTLPTGMNSTSVAVDDLNNDERLDLTILDDSDSVMKVMLGQ